MPTTPLGFYYADGSTPMSAEAISAAEATAAEAVVSNLVSDNRQIQTFVWADAAARTSQTGMVAGDQGYQVDIGVEFRYDGSSWRPRDGVQRVRPGSVSVTGGTASVSTSGDITFNLTGAGSVTVLNVFSSVFLGYQIDLTSTAGSASSLTMNLANNIGTQDATANYDRTEILGRNATASSSTPVGGTSWSLGNKLAISQDLIELNSPFVATPTRGFGKAGVHTNPAVSGTSNFLKVDYLTHRSSTAYPSFALNYSAAISGTIRIYGVA